MPNCTASTIRASGGKPGTQAAKMIVAGSSPFTQSHVISVHYSDGALDGLEGRLAIVRRSELRRWFDWKLDRENVARVWSVPFYLSGALVFCRNRTPCPYPPIRIADQVNNSRIQAVYILKPLRKMLSS
jgi:hypothetical protein